MNPTDDELDVLLARGKLSGAQKDRVLAAALAASAMETRRWHQAPWLRWSLAGAFTVLLLLPAVWFARQPESELRVKGEHTGLDVQASCVGTCHVGSTLLLRLGNLHEAGFVVAFARAPSGTVHWYFPSDTGQAPQVTPQEEPVVVAQAIVLGPEHTPGTYQLYTALTPEPLTRAEWTERLKHKPPQALGFVSQALEIVP